MATAQTVWYVLLRPQTVWYVLLRPQKSER